MESVAELWARAQQFESTGNRRESRALYETILTVDPHHVAARLRMSRLDRFGDDYRSSRAHALLAADAIEAQRGVRNLGYVTERLLEFGEDDRVAALVLSADWANPDVIRQSPVLAQHLWLARRYEDALRFLDAVEDRVPPHPLLIFARANVLRYLGKLERAEREYESCLAISPDFADAHLALATHSRADPPLSRVPRIHEALSRSANGGLEEAQLHYALFHELDAAGSCDLAWTALVHGMEIMKRRVTFDARKESERLLAWMRMAFSELRAEAGDVVPIFIAGMPRTGTTLLDRMLSNHSAITSAGELNDFAAAVSEVSGRFFLSTVHRDIESLPRNIDWSMVGRVYLERLRTKVRAGRYVIDKNPQNVFNLPLILKALPQAHVLCMLRDPMDSCFSNLKELFHGNAYPYSYALDDVAEHCLHARTWMEYWQQRAPQSVGLVSYENLVTHPEQSLDGVLRFIGLNSESDLHEISRNRAPVSTASSSQVRGGIHQRGIGAWKRYELQLDPIRKRLGSQ